MSTTLYFSKININSHIFEIYKKPSKLKQILNLLLINIEDDIEYKKEDLITLDDGQTISQDATYRFSSINKLDGEFDKTIVGSIIKSSKLFAKEIDKETNEIKVKSIHNDEIIQFYFDLFKETVAFYTTNRFGYMDFNHVFKELIGKSMEKTGTDYSFEVSLLREGLNLDNIKQELKKIGKIEILTIKIIPPNPDDGFLDEIHRNGEEYLNMINDGNVTNTSIILTSKAPQGLKLDSKIVNSELDKINMIHSNLTAEEAIKKGYATVDATSKGGRLYSTNNNKPIKNTLEENDMQSILDYAKACKKAVQSLFIGK